MKAKIGGRIVELEIEGRVVDGRTVPTQANDAGLSGAISRKVGGNGGLNENQPNTRSLQEKPSGIHLKRAQLGNSQNSQGGALSPYRSKLEAAFARTLEFDRLAGLIQGWKYEPVRFLLPGERNTYKIDFCVWGYQGEPRPVFIEVKGWNKSDDRSLVKQKTAAGLNPWAKFLLMKRQRGMWVEREILSR